MRSALASLALLSACGGAPFPYAGGCGDGVVTEDRRDCYCLADERAGAELVLTQLGLEVPQHVTVWIRASDASFQTGELEWAWGQTLGPDDIVLTRWAGGWAHELLHVLELRGGVPVRVTAAHTEWKPRGWLAAADAAPEPHCD